MLNLKNKNEREEFVKNYKDWTGKKGNTLGVWKSFPKLDLTFYHYEFANKAELIVTEYIEYRTIYEGSKPPYKKDFVSKHRLCLILPENDDYTDSSGMGATYRTYTVEGCSLGTVVDYMTKNRLVI